MVKYLTTTTAFLFLNDQKGYSELPSEGLEKE
jgi:hypothetical protein